MWLCRYGLLVGKAFAEAHGLCDGRQPGLRAAAAWSLSGLPRVLGWIGFSTWGCRVPRNSGHGVAVLSTTPPALSPTVAAVCVGHCQEFLQTHLSHVTMECISCTLGPTKKGPGAGSSASGDDTWDRTALCHWDPAPGSSLMLPFQPRGERGPAESARPEPVTQAPSLLKAHQPLL